MRLPHDCEVGTVLLCEICWLNVMLDPVDSENVDHLTVGGTSLVALSSLLLEDNDLLGGRVLLDSGVDSSVLDVGPSNRGVVGGADHQYIVKADLLADLEWHLFH